MRQRLIDAGRVGGALATRLRGGSGQDRARRRRTLLRFGVLAAVLVLVLSVVGPVLAQSSDSRPYTTTDPKTPEGDMIQGLYRLIFWMGVVVFIFVQFLIVYTAMRFKRRRSQTTRPNQVHGHRTLEITWTVIPAIVLLIIAVPTISTIYSTYAAGDDTNDAIVVEVYGKQWWWEFHYPGMGPVDAQGNATDLITANEVRLPEDQKVVFKLYSNNVIHSFWIPEMTGHMDVIPGHERRLAFTPQTPGTYYGECAEFCGVAHAWMRFVVKVQPRADFDTWTTAMSQPPGAATAAYSPDGNVSRTPREFGLCLQCHNITGTNAIAASAGISSDPTSYSAGPNLTLLACRDTLAAGLLENTPENLALWLLNPGHVKDGNFMYELDAGIKNQGEVGSLTPDQVNVLVAYLESLKPDAGCPENGTERGNMNTDLLADNAAPVSTPAPAAPAATPAAGAADAGTAAPAGAATTVALEGGDLFFNPTELTVAQGGTIALTNSGVLPHNFAIEGYNDAAPVDMPNGQTVNWTVPADLAPGTYTFYCEVPGHRQAGMEGTITITAPGAAGAAPAAATPAPATTASTTSVALEGGDLFFNPTELTVEQGGTIALTNSGALPHNFAIEGYNDAAPVDMPNGQTVNWTVPADLAPGTYTFYCEVPGHRQAGMEGTITIIAPGAAAPAAGGAVDAGATPAAAPADAAPVTSVALEGGDLFFNPTELTVAQGGTIALTNSGVLPHNFAIEGYNDAAPVDMPNGQTVNWTVPADLAPGTYTFYCEVPGHRQAGMEGTITITAP